jgi:hypothetical protein
LIFLAALGTPLTGELERACTHVLDHSRLLDGRFSAKQNEQGAVACLSGNLLRAMSQMGFIDDRLDESSEAMAKAVLRDEFRCRYNAPGAGPGAWPARMSDGLPCAWGAIKVLGALAEVPLPRRSTTMRDAIEASAALLLAHDLVRGDYPTSTEPSPLWQRFGFPLGYTSDLLEALEVLGQLGAERTPQITRALHVVRGKMGPLGRWSLEYTPENTWASFGELGQDNKWVTLRALAVFKLWEAEDPGAEWQPRDP